MLLFTPRASTLLALTLLAGVANGQYARFSRDTDTIQLSGDTILGTTATFEAVIRLDALNPNSFIWNEWRSGGEDKQLDVYGQLAGGYAYPNGSSGLSSGTIPLNTFIHVAFVLDGALERLYIGGNHVASRTVASPVSNAPTTGGAIGRNWGRGDVSVPSFHGYIDSFRVSNVARYVGSSFTAPAGDLASDAYTQLLLNFDDAPGTTVPVVQGTAGITGHLGAGNPSATSPQFVGAVPEPSSLAALGLGAAALLRRRRK